MNGRFYKVLALIDYSEASLQAAEEAALIASKFGGELQLQHISSNETPSGLMTSGAAFLEMPEKKEEQYYSRIAKLEKIKKDLERRYSILITCFETRGDFIDVVQRHVKDFLIDLIVLGAKKRSWFREFFIESKARSVIRGVDCEVLCVHSESKSETVKKIVVPVGKSIPTKKIGIAYEIAKKFGARIYLITLNESGKNLNGQSPKTLVASYRYLRDLTSIPIECSTVEGKNVADATMHYAETVGADLILIEEGPESDLTKLLWSGNIVNHSSIPVLSVQCINGGSKTKYRA
jgi:nucleotide-binding universal stress UspA family protein